MGLRLNPIARVTNLGSRERLSPDMVKALRVIGLVGWPCDSDRLVEPPLEIEPAAAKP